MSTPIFEKKKHRLGLEKHEMKCGMSVATSPRTGIMIGGRSRIRIPDENSQPKEAAKYETG
jgi:hypothetical protein